MDDYNITTKNDIATNLENKDKKTSRKLHRSKPSPLALEQRMMFDGAAVATAVVVDAGASAPTNADTNSTAEVAKQTTKTAPVVSTVEAPQTEIISPVVTDINEKQSENIDLSAQPGRELLFVDSSITDISSLLAGVKPGVEVIILNPDQDPWVQMTEVITRYDNVSAVHLVSHGAEGQIILAGTAYDEAAIQLQADNLALWQSHMTQDADILVYGCDVATGDQGQSLITSIARITAADVAASINDTGGTSSGGDWVLESQTGAVESTLFASQYSLNDYSATLAFAATLDSASDTGISNDRITSDNTPTINITGATTGSSGANRFEVIFRPSAGNDITATNLSLGSSSASYTTADVLSDGTYTVLVRTYKGGTTYDSTSFTITIDTSAPTQTVSTLSFSADTFGSTGTSSDFITKTASQTISGTLSANLLTGETVQVSLDNGSTWTTATTTAGANTFSLSNVTLTGSNTMQVRVTDAAGNVGTARTQAYVLDTTVAAPTVTLRNDNGSLNNDNISNDGSLSVAGRESGALVEYSANGSDGWSSSAPSLVEGSNTVYVRQTDLAGNVSSTSTLTFTYDSSAPSVPVISLSNDTGISGSDNITNVGTIHLTGVETGATVEYSANGTNGWSATAPRLNQGSNTVYVRQTDLAGNVSQTTSITFTYDTTVPTPTLSAASFTSNLGNATVRSSETGTGYIVRSDVSVTNLADITGAADNVWNSVNITSANTDTNISLTGLADGTYKLYVVDAAGNLSVASSNSIVIDSIAPNAPVISNVSDNVNPLQGSILNGGLTNDATPTIRVSLTNTNAVAGDSVQVFDGDTALSGLVTLLASDITNGYKDITPSSLSDKTYSLKAKVRDAAGNWSNSSNGDYAITIDTTAPVITSDSFSSAANGQNVVYQAIATDANYQGATITWTLTGRDAEFLNIDSSGLVTLKSGNLDRGTKSTYNFNVVATDALLNSSDVSVSVAVEVPFDGMLVLAGTPSPGSTSTVYFSSLSDMSGPSLLANNGKVIATTFTYQWEKQDNSGKWVKIPSGQGGSSQNFTFTDSDVGAKYRVVATASSGSGSDKLTRTYTSETLLVGASVTTAAPFSSGSGYIAFDTAYGGQLVSMTGNDNQANYFDLTDDGANRTNIAFYASSDTLHNANVGNNVGGFLVYTDGNGNTVTIQGTLSRVYKTNGNNIQAVYFLEDGVDEASRRAFLLDLDSSSGTDFDQALFYKTSSDPIKKLFQAFDSTLSVSDVSLDEDSTDYAVFTVSGEPRTKIQLTVIEGVGEGYADLGDNYQIQYLANNNQWIDYDPAKGVQLDSQGTLKVRVSIVAENDTLREVTETFQLKATAVLDIGEDTGTATIIDNDPTIDVIGNLDVSEGSVAVFEVVISDAQKTAKEISLTLLNGTAQADDYSSEMVAFYLDGGVEKNLPIVNGKVSLPAGVTKFFVRVQTVDDNLSPVFEGPETFSLRASISERYSDLDIATILDNGLGKVYNNDGTVNNNGIPDNDTPSIYVLGSVVGEGAGYAYFTVGLGEASATDTRVALQVVDGTALANSDYDRLEVEVWNAQLGKNEWVSYSSSVTVAAGETSFRVRVAIINDQIAESPVSEQFTLRAEVIGGAAVGDVGSGAATIIDNDGAGQINISINDVLYNEAAGTATFTVTLSSSSLNTITVDYQTADDTAKAVTDYLSKTGTLTFNPGETTKTITVTIVNDDPLKVYEGLENFQVLLSNLRVQGGYDQTFNLVSDKGPLTSGNDQTLVINDPLLAAAVQYGVGTITLTTDFQTAPFPKTGLPITAGESVSAVTNANAQVNVYVEVNGIRFTLLAAGNANNWTYNAQTGLLESSVDFTEALATIDSESVSLDAYLKENPNSTLIFVYDDNLGGNEQARFVSFQVKVGDDRPVVLDDPLGIGGIIDDGTGLGGTDDDRTLLINDVVVNENSPYAVFKITGAAGAWIELFLSDGFGTDNTDKSQARFGEDYGSNDSNLPGIQIYNGTTWVDYQAGSRIEVPENASLLLARVAILDDADYEGAHTFYLNAKTYSAESGANEITFARGAGIILDDGTGVIFNNSGEENRSAEKDDDRTLKVNSPIVNEGSPFVVFTVTGLPGALMLEVIQNDLARSDPNDPSGYAYLSDDASFTIEFWDGSNWIPYNGSNAVIGDNETTLYVRVGITEERDNPYEGSETFILKATQNSNTSSGVATIKDDGTGAYWIGNNLAPATPQDLRLANLRLDDDLDKDGITPTTEKALADLAASQGVGSGLAGDFNGDGIQDAEQSALATLAWTNANYFNQANDGLLTEIKPIISLSIVEKTGEAVSTNTQLLNIEVVGYSDIDSTTQVTDAGGVKSVTLANGTTAITPWDPIRFAVEGLNDTDLVSADDIDPRDGIQIRILIDISAAGLPAGAFDGYLKYVSQDAVNSGVRDLDGNLITVAGWYDFTQRSTGGDGARYIIEGGKIIAIELIITDNAFGDNDTRIGRIFDPGVPVLRVRSSPQEYRPIPPVEINIPQPTRYPIDPIQINVNGPDAQFIYGNNLRVAVAGNDRDAGQRWFRTSLDDDAISCDVTAQMLDPLESRVDGKLTSAGDKAFRVLVTECDAHTLAVFRGVQDQNLEQNQELNFVIGADAFVHTDIKAIVKLKATLVNGSPLPGWVVFDPVKGTFSGKAPKGTFDVMSVRVTAYDQNGREAAVVFRIHLKDKHTLANAGRHGFAEQMRMASREMSAKRTVTHATAK